MARIGHSGTNLPRTSGSFRKHRAPDRPPPTKANQTTRGKDQARREAKKTVTCYLDLGCFEVENVGFQFLSLRQSYREQTSLGGTSCAWADASGK
jgi:hypothetical protein